MNRTLRTMAGVVCVLFGASCAFCAAAGEPTAAAAKAADLATPQPATIRESCIQAQKDAQAKALKALLDDVLALKVGAARTVKDFVEASDLPKTDMGDLLQGAVEYQPPLISGAATCRVSVGLNGDALRANLKSIQSKHSKKEGEFAALTFDSVGGKELLQSGVSSIVLPAASANRTVAEGVPGWENVTARKRLATEHAALEDALKKLRAELEKTQITDNLTFGALEAANPLAKETTEKFLLKTLPEAKLYFPRGIVEVHFAMAYPSLLDALEEANKNAAKPENKIDAAVLATAKERTKGRGLVTDGCAEVSGGAVGPADVATTAVPVEPSAIQAALKPAPPAPPAVPAGGEGK